MRLIEATRARWQLETVSLLMLCAAAVMRVNRRIASCSGRGTRRERHAMATNADEETSGASEPTLHLNMVFLKQFWRLLKICIPSFLSLEFAQVMLMVVLFIFRTRLTLRIAENVGRSGRYIASGEGVKFRDSVVALGMLSIPGAVLHAGVLYLKIMLRLGLRQNLSNALQREYLEGQKLYHIANVDNDKFSKMQLSVEVREFVRHLISLFMSALTPVVDIVVFSRILYVRGGVAPIAFVASYHLLVSTILSTFFPNFSRLVSVAQNRENTLRSLHAELVRHAEEVSFYGGEDLELVHADGAIRAITRHETRIKNIKWWSSLVELTLAKYGSLCCGYVLCGCMAIRQQSQHPTQAEQVEQFMRDTQIYLPFSHALSRLMLLRQKTAALVTRTGRISAMRDFVASVDAAPAPRTWCAAAPPDARSQCASSVNDTCDLTVSKESAGGGQVASDEAGAEARSMHEGVSAHDDDKCGIVFSHVDVYSPDDRLLVADFSLTVKQGRHVLITGINGSGKTALVRALARLWPVRRGSICAPSQGDLFILPQRVYLFAGTLRAQMMYPTIDTQAGASRFTEEDILAAAAQVGLESVLTREGGLDAQKTWQSTLSGGERQRIALMRVILHRPRFAILDECTSAISQDDELKLYMQLQKAGTTLVTISHRVELRKVHHVFVELDGNGGYHVSDIQ